MSNTFLPNLLSSRPRQEHLGQLATRLSRESPDMPRLVCLESNVWRIIAERRVLKSRCRFKDWALLLWPEFRWAALTATAISGLLAVGMGAAWMPPKPAAAPFSLQAFTSDAASPVYVMLKRQGKASS